MAAIGSLILASCASTNGLGGGRGKTASPHEKIGAPYRINGRLYKPAADPGYNKVGIASWYGSKFHGKLTANGEIFDKNRLSAAHTTLPMPSLVEVKNLENGRRIVVRLNDRGPFVDDRIIDLSRAAAVELGFQAKGLAKVRVRYLGPAPLNQQANRKGHAASRLARNEQASSAQTGEAVIHSRRISRTVPRPGAIMPPPATAPSPAVSSALDTSLTVGPTDPIAALIEASPDTPRGSVPLSDIDARQSELSPPAVATFATAKPMRSTAISAPASTMTEADAVAGVGPIYERGFWISAGDFPLIEDAARAGDALSTIAPAKIIQNQTGDMHHLRLGPFKDRLDALTQLARVIERGYSDARILDPVVY